MRRRLIPIFILSIILAAIIGESAGLACNKLIGMQCPKGFACNENKICKEILT